MPAVAPAIDHCKTADDVRRAARAAYERRRAWFTPKPPNPPKPPLAPTAAPPDLPQQPEPAPIIPPSPEELTRRQIEALSEELERLRATLPSTRPTISEIKAAVAVAYGVPVSELCAARRTARYVQARQVAYLISKILTDASLPAIGRKFGGRDHTTILHGIRKLAWLGDELRARLKLNEPVSLWAATAVSIYPAVGA